MTKSIGADRRQHPEYNDTRFIEIKGNDFSDDGVTTPDLKSLACELVVSLMASAQIRDFQWLIGKWKPGGA